MRRSSAILALLLFGLLLLTIAVWTATFGEDRGGTLTVSFLDVGQGDSVFIEAPLGTQVLIDGGPNRSVLRVLAAHMPWYDRSLDLVIGTHPDADHIGGLLDVLSRYRVGTIMHSSVQGSTALFRSFEDAIAEEKRGGANVITAERGQRIDLGKGAYLEVLSPDRTVANVETNTGCVVTRLVYGNTAFMLPCDAPESIEEYLAELGGKGLRADVLKAGHHGSKTSSSLLFVGFVDPAYAVYSRGCDNSYGHPTKETIETFARFNIKGEDTCTEGSITFTSDGKTVTLQK